MSDYADDFGKFFAEDLAAATAEPAPPVEDVPAEEPEAAAPVEDPRQAEIDALVGEIETAVAHLADHVDQLARAVWPSEWPAESRSLRENLTDYENAEEQRGLRVAVLQEQLQQQMGRLHQQRQELHQQILGLSERLQLDRSLSEAEAGLADFKTRMDRVDGESKQILDTARKAAEADRVRLLADAEAEVERFKAHAMAAAQREVGLRRAEIEAEVVDRAIARAGELLAARMTAADQGRLVDDYAVELANNRTARA